MTIPTTTRAPGAGADTPVTARQIQALQATRRRAGIDDEAWRGRLRSRFDIVSTKDLTGGQADALLADLRRQTGDRLGGPYGAMARALWISAYQLCLVDDRTDAALLAFVTRQTGYRTLAWVRDAKDGRAVVEALKAWIARETGITWTGDPKACVFDALCHRLAAVGLSDHPAMAAIRADWRRGASDAALVAAGRLLRRGMGARA